MHLAEYSGCFLLSPQAIALRLDQDPTWLEGIGTLEVFADDVARIFPSNELPYNRDYNCTSSLVQRLSYTRKGVLMVANRMIPDVFQKAFAAADPYAIPYVQDHYSKIFSPDASGELKISYSTLSKTNPVFHPISDDGTFVIRDVDILGLKSGVRIVATVVRPKRSPDRQVVMLENADDLGKVDEKGNSAFKPIWKPVPWCEGYDVRSLEGFSNGLNNSVYLFVDGKTNSLMCVIDDGKPEVLLEGVKILFRAATGSEVRPNHLTTVLTDTKFIDIRMEGNTPPKVELDTWLRNTNPSLESLFQTVCSMAHPEGVTAPHGMFILDKECSQVLIYRHRPIVLHRAAES